MGVIAPRYKFMAKYGREQDKAEVAKHIDDVLAQPQHDLKDHNIVRSQIAADTSLPLSSANVHTIIDTKNPESLYMTHPMVALVKWHYGDVKEEHWDKIIKHASDRDIMGVMPHMHSDHLARVMNDPNRSADVRTYARREHHWATMREAESGTSIPADTH
jgi:hypothetical protein